MTTHKEVEESKRRCYEFAGTNGQGISDACDGAQAKENEDTKSRRGRMWRGYQWWGEWDHDGWFTGRGKRWKQQGNVHWYCQSRNIGRPH